MSLRFTVLGSGSTGNSTLVSAGDTHVLFDVGLSGRETARRLQECGLSADRISAIVVSHEHVDHCRGVVPFSKDLALPVFISRPALAASEMQIDPERIQCIESGIAFEVCGLAVTPFSISHDAADPVGFRIESNGVRLGLVVDLGYITRLVVERLRGCDAIVMESNHDVNMVKIGPYPWALKQRVLSRRGHLSNEMVAQFLESGFDGLARHVVLAHLSKKNNLPEIALECARRGLESRQGLRLAQTRLEIADPDRIGRTYCC